MHSIYHFFTHLVNNKSSFQTEARLSDFPFDRKMLAYRGDGKFPDLAIRVNPPNSLFTGGELVELKERLQEKGINIESDMRDLLVDIFSEQESFSKVRNVDKASVTLRFRIMTEVKAEGNILNSGKYPDILDNTINLIIPCHSVQDKELAEKRLSSVCLLKQFTSLKIKHHLNGYFLVFQQNLS